MRRSLLINALVVSIVALTAVMPNSSMAWFGGYGGCGYGYGGATDGAISRHMDGATMAIRPSTEATMVAADGTDA